MMGMRCTACDVNFSRSKIDALYLRGVSGNGSLNLQWARVGLLNLDYQEGYRPNWFTIRDGSLSPS
jgi:hypothetical protein